MFQVKDRYYFISESYVDKVWKDNDKYYVKLTTEEVQEIDENTYYNLGGK